MPSERVLVPLVPVYDSVPVLQAAVTINDGNGGNFVSGDIWPSSTSNFYESPSDFQANYTNLVPLFDPFSLDSVNETTLQYARQKAAYDSDGDWGEVPVGSCLHIQIFKNYFAWNSNAPYNCIIPWYPDGQQNILVWDYWSYEPPVFANTPFCNSFCAGYEICFEGQTLTNPPPGVFPGGFGDTYSNLDYWIVTAYKADCDDIGNIGEEPIMVAEPIVPTLPEGVPAPPPPPRSNPTILHGGVVENTGPSPGYVELVPEPDNSVTINLGVPCPCTDGEPGPPGADGEPGPPGADGEPGPPGADGVDLMLVPKRITRPVINPETGEIEPRNIDCFVPGDGTNDLSTLVNEILLLLAEIQMNRLWPLESERSGGDAFPYPDEGVG